MPGRGKRFHRPRKKHARRQAVKKRHVKQGYAFVEECRVRQDIKPGKETCLTNQENYNRNCVNCPHQVAGTTKKRG